MGLELDAWLEKIRKCEILAEEELKALCEYVRAFPSSYVCAVHLSLLEPVLATCLSSLLALSPGERNLSRREQCTACECARHRECATKD
jgi:hypothetical protein